MVFNKLRNPLRPIENDIFEIVQNTSSCFIDNNYITLKYIYFPSNIFSKLYKIISCGLTCTHNMLFGLQIGGFIHDKIKSNEILLYHLIMKLTEFELILTNKTKLSCKIC